MPGCRPLTDDEVDQVMQSFGGRYATRDRSMLSGHGVIGIPGKFAGDVGAAALHLVEHETPQQPELVMPKDVRPPICQAFFDEGHTGW